MGDIVDRLNLGGFANTRESVLTFATLELLSTWSNFARAFYLSCLRGTITASGGKISCTVGFTDWNQAIGVAIRVYRPGALPKADGSWDRRDEPAWHDKNVLMNLCLATGCSHTPEVQRAFSAGYRVFDDLPVYRNFLAHRNQQTMHAAMRTSALHGIPSTWRPSQALLAVPLTGSRPLLLEWVDEVDFTVEYLCH